MSNFDDLKLAVEMVSGGGNTVIYDDMGMPSVMVALPKLKRSDLVIGASDDIHYGWVVDGKEQDVVYMSKYQNIVMNSRAYSLPMQDPQCQVTFDNALTYCRNKGEGWGLPPQSLWAGIALWCKANGFQPNGNSWYGNDRTNTWEKGVPTTYGSDGQVNRCATGSGPATWYHDGTRNGIADMNGNVWDRVSGIRFVYGELQVIPYANSILATCDMGASSDEWKCVDADGNFVDQGSDNTLHLDYVSSAWRWIVGDGMTSVDDSSRNCRLYLVTASDDVSENAKILLRSLGLLPEDGDTDYMGNLYLNNAQAERVPCCGGGWNRGAFAGVFALSSGNARSLSNTTFGFRSAFYGTL